MRVSFFAGILQAQRAEQAKERLAATPHEESDFVFTKLRGDAYTRNISRNASSMQLLAGASSRS
jgi:hypothetical protein